MALRPHPLEPGGRSPHEVLQASTDPPDSEPRVEKTCSEGVPPRTFSIETVGLTDVVTIEFLRDSLLDVYPRCAGSKCYNSSFSRKEWRSTCTVTASGVDPAPGPTYWPN